MRTDFNEKAFTERTVALIRKSSCELPDDIRDALQKAKNAEARQSTARDILDTILENVQAAKAQQAPLCQDTGLPVFYVDHPADISTRRLKKCIRTAVASATKQGCLRPNAVDALSGVNSGDNLGEKIPAFSFTEWDKAEVRVRCLLKGGGSENVSAQYSLPRSDLFAGRDLDGVAACVVDAVVNAQGNGCAPGIIGVGIGGDRVSGMETAKAQLLRRLDDKNDNDVLDKLERSLHRSLNKLGIGPMGLGGKSTVLGVKAGAAHRIPASFFVSVSYMCWACRRAEMHYEC